MKRIPTFKTDAEAEAFLEQDLSDLDFSDFLPLQIEVEKMLPNSNKKESHSPDVVSSKVA